MSKLLRYYASYVFKFPILQNTIDNDSKYIMCPFWHPKVKGVSGWNACHQGMLYIFYQSFIPLMEKELQLQDGNTTLGHNMYTNWCNHIGSTIITSKKPLITNNMTPSKSPFVWMSSWDKWILIKNYRLCLTLCVASSWLTFVQVDFYENYLHFLHVHCKQGFVFHLYMFLMFVMPLALW